MDGVAVFFMSIFMNNGKVKLVKWVASMHVVMEELLVYSLYIQKRTWQWRKKCLGLIMPRT